MQVAFPAFLGVIRASRKDFEIVCGDWQSCPRNGIREPFIVGSIGSRLWRFWPPSLDGSIRNGLRMRFGLPDVTEHS